MPARVSEFSMEVVAGRLADVVSVIAKPARRPPGIIGRHLHMFTMWGIALVVGAYFHLWVFAQAVMAVELIHQNDHVCLRHREDLDWRRRDWVAYVGVLAVAGVLVHLAYLSPEVIAWQVLGAFVYCLGQYRWSAIWHKFVHARNPISGKRLVESVAWGLAGLGAMIWGVYFAL